MTGACRLLYTESSGQGAVPCQRRSTGVGVQALRVECTEAVDLSFCHFENGSQKEGFLIPIELKQIKNKTKS